MNISMPVRLEKVLAVQLQPRSQPWPSSAKLTAEEKEGIAVKLKSLSTTDDFTEENINISKSTRLADLVDERSCFLFSELGICGTAWLGLPVEQWEDDDEFKNSRTSRDA